MSSYPFGRVAVGGNRRARATEEFRWLVAVAASCALLGVAGAIAIMCGGARIVGL